MPDLRARLAALEANDLRRRLSTPAGIDLTSNDVLGLATHPDVRDALVAALVDGVPHGGRASRLLTGQHPAWTAFEERFAAWQRAEAALFHATGYAANQGLLSCLPAPGDLLVCDALLHASLIDGARLSKAERVIVPHQDLDAAERVLAARGARDAWVVVESVYSMDGDETDLLAWAELCDRHGAHLIVDEAHATGLYGPSGEGRVVEAGLREVVFATVHTCSKALGGQGGLVVGGRDLVDWLVNQARPFVFSTAPPPFLAAGLTAAVEIVRTEPGLRVRPRLHADRLRGALAGHLDTGTSSAHVVPVMTGSAASALDLAAWLRRLGWDARAIRPPTVPLGTSRVRLVPHATLTSEDVDRLAIDLLAWTS